MIPHNKPSGSSNSRSRSATKALSASQQRAVEEKRLRGELSCAECRRLKLRCDRVVPCGSCVRRGCGSICPSGVLEAGAGHVHQGGMRVGQLRTKIAIMAGRIRELEGALGDENKGHALLDEKLLRIGKADEEPPPGDSVEDLVGLDGMGTLTLGDDGQVNYFGTSAGNESLIIAREMLASSDSDDDTTQITPPNPGVPQELFIPFLGLPQRTHVPLPPPDKANALAQVYLAHGALFFRAWKPHELYNEVLPRVYGPNGASTHLLAALFFAFALGTYLDPSIPAPEHEKEADRWFRLGRAAFSEPPPTDAISQRSPPGIEDTIRALGLLGTYFSMAARAHSRDSAWSALALASKLAQGAGLHRDPARWGLPQETVQRRRALFWEVFQGDVSHSIALGRPLTTGLGYVDCEFPESDGEAEDANMSDGAGGESDDICLLKYRFSRDAFVPIMDLVLTARPAPASPGSQFPAMGVKKSYKDVLELDARIRKMSVQYQIPVVSGGAPEGERNGNGRGLGINRNALKTFYAGQYLNAVLLTLHRGFMARAMLNPPSGASSNPSQSANPSASSSNPSSYLPPTLPSGKPFDPFDISQTPYAPSVSAAYHAAEEILRALGGWVKTAPEVAGRVWFLTYHGFSAGLILGALASRAPGSPHAPSALMTLSLAVDDVFAKYTRLSPRHRIAYMILRKLRARAVRRYTAFLEGKSGNCPDKDGGVVDCGVGMNSPNGVNGDASMHNGSNGVNGKGGVDAQGNMLRKASSSSSLSTGRGRGNSIGFGPGPSSRPHSHYPRSNANPEYGYPEHTYGDSGLNHEGYPHGDDADGYRADGDHHNHNDAEDADDSLSDLDHDSHFRQKDLQGSGAPPGTFEDKIAIFGGGTSVLTTKGKARSVKGKSSSKSEKARSQTKAKSKSSSSKRKAEGHVSASASASPEASGYSASGVETNAAASPESTTSSGTAGTAGSSNSHGIDVNMGLGLGLGFGVGIGPRAALRSMAASASRGPPTSNMDMDMGNAMDMGSSSGMPGSGVPGIPNSNIASSSGDINFGVNNNLDNFSNSNFQNVADFPNLTANNFMSVPDNMDIDMDHVDMDAFSFGFDNFGTDAGSGIVMGMALEDIGMGSTTTPSTSTSYSGSGSNAGGGGTYASPYLASSSQGQFNNGTPKPSSFFSNAFSPAIAFSPASSASPGDANDRGDGGNTGNTEEEQLTATAQAARMFGSGMYPFSLPGQNQNQTQNHSGENQGRAPSSSLSPASQPHSPIRSSSLPRPNNYSSSNPNPYSNANANSHNAYSNSPSSANSPSTHSLYQHSHQQQHSQPSSNAHSPSASFSQPQSQSPAQAHAHPSPSSTSSSSSAPAFGDESVQLYARVAEFMARKGGAAGVGGIPPEYMGMMYQANANMNLSGNNQNQNQNQNSNSNLSPMYQLPPQQHPNPNIHSNSQAHHPNQGYHDEKYDYDALLSSFRFAPQNSNGNGNGNGGMPATATALAAAAVKSPPLSSTASTPHPHSHAGTPHGHVASPLSATGNMVPPIPQTFTALEPHNLNSGSGGYSWPATMQMQPMSLGSRTSSVLPYGQVYGQNLGGADVWQSGGGSGNGGGNGSGMG